MLFALLALSAVAAPLLQHLPLSVAGVFAVCMAARFALLLSGIRSLKFAQTAVMLGAATALVIYRLGTIFGLQGGISLLLLLALLKSCEGGSRRDWQVLVLVMLFLLAGAVLFDQSLLTGLWVLVCLMLMACTLAVLNEVPLKTAASYSLTAFLLTILPMVLLFVAAPRRATPLWGIPQPASQATTGMSDTMKPGSISNLVQSNQPVFSATFPPDFTPKQKDLYWRVMIMGDYTGESWQATDDFTDSAAIRATARTIPYSIILEDDKGRIPVLDYPEAQAMRGYQYAAGQVLRTGSRKGLRRLKLHSTLGNELPHRLSQAEFAYYTFLPASGNPRTHMLAKELYRQSQGDAETFARQAYRYFQNQNFTYTLRPPLLEDNATDRFLFESKQGFCEHYADAFVVMARAAGIPARVVTGYQGGEYHPESGFWQIRGKDAHAWAEIWLPEKRVWLRIDPTAAVSAVRIDSGLIEALPENELGELVSGSRFWQNWSDRSRYYWQQWVVNYDADRQQNLLGKLGLSHIGTFGIIILLAMGSIPALAPLWLWWRRIRSQENSDPLARGFLALKHSLLGRHFPDAAALGPKELMQLLQDNNILNPELDTLIEDFIKLQYRNGANGKQAAAWFARAQKLSRKYRNKETS